ncbi:hypothetical protein LCGC14_1500880 [marine sediment metagenome]|uniref:Uncharacterized protein n=1 Tax=marine sediment metagenome TaxID=412755 RepID=A0A0F9M5L0_9ZZZZ
MLGRSPLLACRGGYVLQLFDKENRTPIYIEYGEAAQSVHPPNRSRLHPHRHGMKGAQETTKIDWILRY